MPWANGTIFTLTIPSDASDTDPRITIGEDLPAALVAAYAAAPWLDTLVGGIVVYSGNANGDYEYIAMGVHSGGSQANLYFGASVAGVITQAIALSGNTATLGGNNAIGGAVGGTLMQAMGATWEIGNGAGGAGNTGQLLIRNGSQLRVIETGGLLRIASPATIQIDSGAAFTIDGTSAGRGLVPGTWLATTANSAAIATGTAIESGSGTFVNGRAFRMVVQGGMLGSSVGNQPQVFLRAGPNSPTGGTVRQMTVDPMTATAQNVIMEAVFVNTSGSNQTGTVAAVFLSGVGTTTHTATATAPRYIYAQDIGAAADYPGAISLP
jgi:hypothetical protein